MLFTDGIYEPIGVFAEITDSLISAPLCPSSPNTSPLSTEKLSLSTTVLPLYVFVISETSILFIAIPPFTFSLHAPVGGESTKFYQEFFSYEKTEKHI